jgi:F-type H+-transporting ATPase subunit delta
MIPVAVDRWVLAFTEVGGENSCSGLTALRELGRCVRDIPGNVSGSTAAAHLGRMIRLARESAGADGPDPGLDLATAFLLLVVKKGLAGHLDDFIQGIEQRLDAQKGILTVYAESAFPLDKELRAALESGLRERTGAAGVRLISQAVPELLGGCRLRLGSEIIDASLRGQLQQMARNLHAAPVPPV